MEQTPQVPEGHEQPTGFEDEDTLPPLTATEEAMLDEAEADIAAGRVIDAEVFLAWMRSLGTDHELPPPVPD